MTDDRRQTQDFFINNHHFNLPTMPAVVNENDGRQLYVDQSILLIGGLILFLWIKRSNNYEQKRLASSSISNRKDSSKPRRLLSTPSSSYPCCLWNRLWMYQGNSGSSSNSSNKKRNITKEDIIEVQDIETGGQLMMLLADDKTNSIFEPKNEERLFDSKEETKEEEVNKEDAMATDSYDIDGDNFATSTCKNCIGCDCSSHDATNAISIDTTTTNSKTSKNDDKVLMQQQQQQQKQQQEEEEEERDGSILLLVQPKETASTISSTTAASVSVRPQHEQDDIRQKRRNGPPKQDTQSSQVVPQQQKQVQEIIAILSDDLYGRSALFQHQEDTHSRLLEPVISKAVDLEQPAQQQQENVTSETSSSNDLSNRFNRQLQEQKVDTIVRFLQPNKADLKEPPTATLPSTTARRFLPTHDEIIDHQQMGGDSKQIDAATSLQSDQHLSSSLSSSDDDDDDDMARLLHMRNKIKSRNMMPANTSSTSSLSASSSDGSCSSSSSCSSNNNSNNNNNKRNNLVVICRTCKIQKHWTQMKKCSKCKLVVYCSSECQQRDWLEGNHKQQCGTITSNRRRRSSERVRRRRRRRRRTKARKYQCSPTPTTTSASMIKNSTTTTRRPSSISEDVIRNHQSLPSSSTSSMQSSCKRIANRHISWKDEINNNKTTLGGGDHHRQHQQEHQDGQFCRILMDVTTKSDDAESPPITPIPNRSSCTSYVSTSLTTPPPPPSPTTTTTTTKLFKKKNKLKVDMRWENSSILSSLSSSFSSCSSSSSLVSLSVPLPQNHMALTKPVRKNTLEDLEDNDGVGASNKSITKSSSSSSSCGSSLISKIQQNANNMSITANKIVLPRSRRSKMAQNLLYKEKLRQQQQQQSERVTLQQNELTDDQMTKSIQTWAGDTQVLDSSEQSFIVDDEQNRKQHLLIIHSMVKDLLMEQNNRNKCVS